MSTAYYTKPRQGIIQSIVEGQKQAINYFNSYTPVPPVSIYDLTDSNVISTFFKTGLGTADDYLISEGWNFDENAATVVPFDSGDVANTFTSTLGLTSTTVSPHGRAITQTAAGNAWVLDTASFNFSTEAFAFIGRLTVPGTPAGDVAWISKNNLVSPHYASYILSTGEFRMHVKEQMGGAATTATTAGSVADNVPRWVAFGRSIVGSTIWVAIDGEKITTAFAAAKNIDNAGGIGDTALTYGISSTGAGSVTSSLDHLFIFTNADAENVYTNIQAIFDSVLTD